MHNRMLQLNYLLMSFMTSAVLTAQVLGFLGMYTPVLAWGMTGLVAVGIFSWLRWQGLVWHERAFQPVRLSEPAQLRLSILGVGLGLMAIVFVGRILLFPYSNVGLVVPEDLFNYHAPFAVELVRRGTLWHIAMPYGDYPNGYESLLALHFGVTGDFVFIGWIHGLIILWLWTSIYLLVRRYTRLSEALALGVALATLFVPAVYTLLFIIGKNDVWIAVLVLSAVLFAPLGRAQDSSAERAWHPLALALCSATALASKPHVAPILAFLWLWAAGQTWRAWRVQGKLMPALWLWMTCAGVMALGLLWVVRNLLLMGAWLSPSVEGFFVTSLLANATNPNLYLAGRESLWLFIVAGGTLALLGMLAKQRRLSMGMALLVLVMWLTFAITPLGAFRSSQDSSPLIQWRYVLHLTVLLWVLGVLCLEGLLLGVYQRLLSLRAGRTLMSVGLAVAGLGVLLYLNLPAMYAWYPEQARIFAVPRDEMAGSGVYRYIHEQVRGANIFATSQAHYYVYGADFSNRILSGSFYPEGANLPPSDAVPEYALAWWNSTIEDFSQRWLGRPDYQWRLVLDDGQMRLYERVD